MQNKQLEEAYMAEKKKLEFEIIKENMKNEVTWKIMNMVDDGRESPRPQYKYERIKDKYYRTQNISSINNNQNINKKVMKAGDKTISIENLDTNRSHLHNVVNNL